MRVAESAGEHGMLTDGLDVGGSLGAAWIQLFSCEDFGAELLDGCVKMASVSHEPCRSFWEFVSVQASQQPMLGNCCCCGCEGNS